MSTVALWYDGGDGFGWGNIRRSLELGERLADRGHRVSLHPLSSRAAELSDHPQPSSPPRADVAILDLPYPGDAILETARASSRRILALDYSGTTAPDLAVSLQGVRPLPAHARHLVGVEYAIIREELRRAVADPASAGATLVILGGGDRSGLTEQVIHRLQGKVSDLTIIEGPLAASDGVHRPEVRRLRQPPDLPARMAGCSWAVTTGGTTMLEFLSLGRAVHVIPRTPEELTFADRFLAAGALLGVGLDALEAPTEGAVRDRGAVGRRLVDGAGSQRIANLVEELAA